MRPVDDNHVCPEVVRFDADERVLVLEDLRSATRLDEALREGRKVTVAMETLARFLARVHSTTAEDPGLAAAFQNHRHAPPSTATTSSFSHTKKPSPHHPPPRNAPPN